MGKKKKADNKSIEKKITHSTHTSLNNQMPEKHQITDGEQHSATPQHIDPRQHSEKTQYSDTHRPEEMLQHIDTPEPNKSLHHLETQRPDEMLAHIAPGQQDKNLQQSKIPGSSANPTSGIDSEILTTVLTQLLNNFPARTANQCDHQTQLRPEDSSVCPECQHKFHAYTDLYTLTPDDSVLESLFIGTILNLDFLDFLLYFEENYLPADSELIDCEQVHHLINIAYNRFLLHTMANIKKSENKKEFVHQFFQSTLFPGDSCRTFKKWPELLSKNARTHLPELHPTLKERLEQALITFIYLCFIENFIHFQVDAGQKVFVLKKDLFFLSNEIVRLSSADAGIVQVAQALSLSSSARFAEDNNYDKIFKAVEELADTIKYLAKIYQNNLKNLNSLLPFSLSRRPEDNKCE